MKNEKSGGVKSAVKSLLVATLGAAITVAFMLIAVACAKSNGSSRHFAVGVFYREKNKRPKVDK